MVHNNRLGLGSGLGSGLESGLGLLGRELCGAQQQVRVRVRFRVRFRVKVRVRVSVTGMRTMWCTTTG